MKNAGKKLPATAQKELLHTLKTRFEKHPQRHLGIAWESIQKRLEAQPARLWALQQMEVSGGEPDLVRFEGIDDWVFCDCSAESPNGRRSLCYDEEALLSRKEHKPRGSALGLAEELGVEMLDENQYRQLQQGGAYDLKTSSWVLTPQAQRSLSGALFCDRRFDRVFVYHNTAESYYASRGFRALLRF